MRTAARESDHGPGRFARLALQAFVIVAGVCTLGLAIAPAFRASLDEGGPKNDFASFYIGARMAGTAELYNSARSRQEQALLGVRDTQHPMPFIRPPFCAILYHPLSRLDYGTAYLVFQLFSAAAFVAGVLLWRRLGPGMVLMIAAWSVPMAHALLRGQDTSYWFLLISAASALLRRGQNTAAGAVLSLACIKWNLLLTLPVFIVGRKLWNLGTGFITGCAILCGLSFLAAGRSWPRDYFAALMDPSITPHPDSMPNIRGLVHGLPDSAAIEAFLALLILALTWRVARHASSTDYALAATLAGGVLVSHHAYLYDALAFLPAIWLSVQQTLSAWLRRLAVLMAAPPFYAVLLFPRWSCIGQLAIISFFLALVWDTALGRPSAGGRTASGRTDVA